MLEEEGYRLMGAAFEVFNQLGHGMAEEVYQQSLEIELELRAIPFLSKQQLAVFYKNRRLETSYCPDLLVFGSIVVELKAVTGLPQITKLNCLITCASQINRSATCSTSEKRESCNGRDLFSLICEIHRQRQRHLSKLTRKISED